MYLLLSLVQLPGAQAAALSSLRITHLFYSMLCVCVCVKAERWLQPDPNDICKSYSAPI